MITTLQASFNAQKSRSAAISGAYQYDTGQRIRMHGLPSPQELSEMDDFLSGDVVTVQAQFAYMSDAQSEPRLASYDGESGAWIVDVPDSYLTRSEAVHVYVYVMHGANAEHSRARTMYAGSFTPIARPAPSTTVTPDQLSAWDVLVAEVNLTLAEMNAAISGANAAATGANEAARRADDAGAAWENATATATTLSPGSEATVTLTGGANGRQFAFGIPRGEKGDKGDTGTAGVTFRLEGDTLYIDTV